MSVIYFLLIVTRFPLPPGVMVAFLVALKKKELQIICNSLILRLPLQDLNLRPSD